MLREPKQFTIGNPTPATPRFTVSAWIKVNKFDADWQAIVAIGDTAWRLQRNWGNNILEFACNGVYVPVNNIYSLYGVTNVNDGKWHHVAGTNDCAEMRLDVDGKLDTAKPASGPILANESPVFISANAEKPGRCFNGLIHEIRI
ncbi:MAG: LamG domain-containing protein [Phycisphaerae bacterium]|nr:LamG domain-containing protein [Phycisphaerae bacterium]